MSFHYIFVGLPGAGKTTLLKAIAAKYPNIRLFLMDDEIKIRLNKLTDNPEAKEQLANGATDDPLINTFYEKWSKQFGPELAIKALLRESYPKHSSAVMHYLGDQQWRELEAAIAADFLEKEQGCAFDLGGSQPLNETVQKVCKEVGIQFIFLKANHDTICNHLRQPQADGRPRWQHISNYQAAGEMGWEALALQHRQAREAKLQLIADLTLETSGLAVEEVLLITSAAIAEYELKNQAEIKGQDNSEKHAKALVYKFSQIVASDEDAQLAVKNEDDALKKQASQGASQGLRRNSV